MKRVLVVAGLFAMVALCFLFMWRVNGKVLAEEKSPPAQAIIRVRQLQPNPFTIGGLLGLGESIYRCEYYINRSVPMYSSQSYSGESFFPSHIKIEWKEASVAEVLLDECVKFECKNGDWRRLDD